MTNRHPTMNTSINESTPTSLAQLFSQTINGTQVEAIEFHYSNVTMRKVAIPIKLATFANGSFRTFAVR